MNRVTAFDLGKIGFGCLQLESVSDEIAVNVIVEAYKKGIRLFDTAAAYGSDRHNEKILSSAIDKIKKIYGETSHLFISTKCGINFSTLQTSSRGYEGGPDQIRDSVERSLIELGIDQIPLVYLHRIDPAASEEDRVASFIALRTLVEEGKVRYVGLSECTAQDIIKADEIFQKCTASYNPFAFVQSAFSIATQRAGKNGVLRTCQERGIQFVSYTSIVRGLVDTRISEALSLKDIEVMGPERIISVLKTSLEIPENDFKLFVGFFHTSVIKDNLTCILRFHELARAWEVSPSQLALAWQVAQGVIPIPGTTKLDHLSSNVESVSIKLSSDQIIQISDCFKNFAGNPNVDGVLDDNSLEV